MGRNIWVLLLWVFNAQAVTLEFTVPEDLSSIGGYEIHYGSSSGEYNTTVDLDGPTNNTVEIHPGNGIWYFAARSRNADTTAFSLFSNEVHANIGEIPYGDPVAITDWHVTYDVSEDQPVATVTKTVAASGADYTTISGALGWFQSNHDFDTDGIARILITDTSTYTISSSISLTGISGTPSITAYLEVTSNASDPFSGPTLNLTQTSTGGLENNLDYTHIHNLSFQLNNTSNSTECIRLQPNNSDNVLISRNSFVALQQSYQQDGIYFNNGAFSNVRISNNYFAGFRRAAIHLQNYSSTATLTADIRFNSIASFSTELDGGGILFREPASNGDVSATLYNNLIYGHTTTRDNYRLYAGTPTLTGSNNISDDTTAESNFTSSYDSVTFTESEPSSGENAWLTEIDDATETNLDLSIVGENAYTVTGNGVDQAGSEPDSRQDFSIDIMGNSRGATPDIGAFEFVDVSVGASFIPKSAIKSLAHVLVR